MQQQEAPLPAKRLEQTPPFRNIGMDVFGHFTVSTGRGTRSNPGTKKVWVLLITCLYTRGVHLELLESMSTAGFRNAFTIFEAIRGECKYIHSDRGTNFMGARNEDDQRSIESSTQELAELLIAEGREWRLNPPRASHFGGVWERVIGSVRKVIDASLLHNHGQLLNTEEFRTLIATAARVVNDTPLWSVPDCPLEPLPLSPSMLINQRESNELGYIGPIPDGDITIRSRKAIQNQGITEAVPAGMGRPLYV